MRILIAKVAAILGAIVCIIVAVYFANIQEDMWPFPGLYLIEIALAGLAGAILASDQRPQAILAVWGLSGILLTFTYLGIFSIGPLIAPAFLCFVASAILKSWRSKSLYWRGFLTLLAALLAQGGLMFAMLRVIQ